MQEESCDGYLSFHIGMGNISDARNNKQKNRGITNSVVYS